jgi:hypothetical protein
MTDWPNGDIDIYVCVQHLVHIFTVTILYVVFNLCQTSMNGEIRERERTKKKKREREASFYSESM